MNKQERDELILSNQKLVYSTINKLYPTYRNDEDMIQEGMVGLIRAADTWDESKSKFSTYAVHCIRNHLIDYMRSQLKQPNSLSLDYEYDEDCNLGDLIVGNEDIDLTGTVYESFYETLSEEDKLLLDLAPTHSRIELAKIFDVNRATITIRKKRLLKEWNKFNER